MCCSVWKFASLLLTPLSVLEEMNPFLSATTLGSDIRRQRLPDLIERTCIKRLYLATVRIEIAGWVIPRVRVHVPLLGIDHLLAAYHLGVNLHEPAQA